MQTMKKILSLALVLATLCSLCLISPARASGNPGLNDGDRIQFISALGYAVNDQYAKRDSSTQTAVLDNDNDEENECLIVHTGLYGDTLVYAFEFSHHANRYLNVYGGSAACRGDSVKVFYQPDVYNDLACWFYIEDAGNNFIRLRSVVKPSYYLDTYGCGCGCSIRLYTLDTNSTDQLFAIVKLSGNATFSVNREDLDYYRQNLSKWSDVTYTPKGCSKRTMYDSACGVFALANCIHAISGMDFSDQDIIDLANYAIRNGYRTSSGTSKELAVGLASDYGDVYGIKTGTTYYYSSRTSTNRSTKQAFNDVLDNGGALYFSVTSSSGGHIMAAVDHRVSSDGRDEYLLVDSYTTSSRLGSGVMKSWASLDDSLDFHVISNGKTIVTKGSLGYYTILPR